MVDCPYCEKPLTSPSTGGLHNPCHERFNVELDAAYPLAKQPQPPEFFPVVGATPMVELNRELDELAAIVF